MMAQALTLQKTPDNIFNSSLSINLDVNKEPNVPPERAFTVADATVYDMEDVRGRVRTTGIGTLSKAKEQRQRREREGREEPVCETHGDRA